MKPLFYLSLLFISPIVGASQLVLTCEVGAEASTHVEVMRDAKVGDSHIYYLQQDGKFHPLFGSIDDSRGSNVHVACAGKKTACAYCRRRVHGHFFVGFCSDSERGQWQD